MKNTKRTERKVNAIVDEILDEDQENDFDGTRSENCPRDCEEPDDTPKEISRQCKCGVENSARFSLRVLEAMRSLQRDLDQSFTSNPDDIVDYIRANYRHDGDLYAQVRTALRQVCSQGFVMELFNNEYHLIGPVVSAMKPNGCSLNCGDVTSTKIYDDSRRRKRLDNRRNGVCRCTRFLRRNGRPQDTKLSREEPLEGTFTVDRDKNSITKPRFHSTRMSADVNNNADYQDTEFDTEILPSCNCNDIRDDHRQRDMTGIREIEKRDKHAEPIPGPSRDFVRALSPIPARGAKQARLEDQLVQRADENDEETTTEEDEDCTCNTNGVTRITRDEPTRRRPANRTRIRNQWNGQRRENDGEEDEKDEKEEAEEENEDEDTEDEDSAYRELRERIPRGRNTARERELKRWIRRCRKECEQRKAR